MSKTWENFLKKVNHFQDWGEGEGMPLDYWGHYQLLGYFCHRAGYKLEPKAGKSPSYHPHILQMRYLITYFYGLKFFPVDFDPIPIKNFFDYVFDRCDRVGIRITSICYLSNDKALDRWLDLWINGEPETLNVKKFSENNDLSQDNVGGHKTPDPVSHPAPEQPVKRPSSFGHWQLGEIIADYDDMTFDYTMVWVEE